MKLKCETHNRRVLSLPNSDSLHHRTGDMSKCDGKVALLTDQRGRTTRSYGVRPSIHVTGEYELHETGCNKLTKRVALEDLIND